MSPAVPLHDQPLHAQPLLARYAESLFWMARYLERTENLARVLDVTQTFEASGRPAQAWESVVRINADEEEFARRYGRATPEAVRRFYLLAYQHAKRHVFDRLAARRDASVSAFRQFELALFRRRLAGVSRCIRPR